MADEDNSLLPTEKELQLFDRGDSKYFNRADAHKQQTILDLFYNRGRVCMLCIQDTSPRKPIPKYIISNVVQCPLCDLYFCKYHIEEHVRHPIFCKTSGSNREERIEKVMVQVIKQLKSNI